MVLRHLGWLVLAHALLAVHSNSGDGVDDGSDGGSATGPERCIEPDPRPKPLGTGIKEMKIESRCYLNCIEKIFLQEDIPLEVSTRYPAWPTIPDSVLERNCSINAMVKKCQLSCSQLKYSHCLRKCSNEDCMEDDPQNCQICNQHYCDLGCEIHLAQAFNITNDTQADGTPPSPVGPLELRAAEGLADHDFRSTSDAGLYYMDPVNAVPAEESSDEMRYPTVPIIRVTLGRKIKYIWMTNFNGILNLTAYACKEVFINLGVVNKFGLAHERFGRITSLPIEVHGENPPTFASHPDGVRTSIDNDIRPGYWKHAVINLSWKRPRRGFGLLDHYVVTFKLDTKHDQPYCKQESKTVRVNKTFVEDVNLPIKADSLEDGPVSDCHYTVQIESISVDQNIATPPVDIHDVHVNSSHTIPVPLNLTCNRTWDEKSGNFTYKLDWVMPDDMNVRSAVGSFEVMVDLIGPDGNNETLDTSTFPADWETYHYSREVKYDERNYKHRITMSSKPGNQSLLVVLPAPRVCERPAEAVPPPQVEDVKAEFIFRESSKTFELVANWSSVETENAFYKLRVVNQNTTKDDISAVRSVETAEAETVIKIALDNTQPYLYIQVRAVSRHMATGPWSEAVQVELPSFPSPPHGSSEPTLTSPREIGEPNSSNDGNGQVTYIIVSVTLVLILCIAVVAVVMFLVYYPSRRSKKRDIRKRRMDTVMFRKTSEKDRYIAGRLDQWEIYSNQMAIQNRLGDGAFGEVYQGLFNSSITEKEDVKKIDAKNSVVVAVKLLREDAMDKDREIFLKHILQAKKVAGYQHPHLVCLVGCVTEQEPLSLLMEYPEQGDLLTYLRTQRHELYQAQMQYLDYQDDGEGPQLPTIMPQYSSKQNFQAQDLMLFISHVAAGLEHLTSIGVVHGDIACRNLFLTADKVVKIADFGLDSISDEEKGLIYMANEFGRLPIRWMAIEAIRDGDFSSSSDVWAFGVTLWEIASLGGFPYHDTANCDILATLSAGQRLQCPTNCSEEIYGIMLKCCAAVPNDRPSFSTLHHVFKSLHSTDNDGQYITLNIDMNSSYYLHSPRSSTIESGTVTDECAPLVDPLGSDPFEVVVVVTQQSPHTKGGTYTGHSMTGSYGYSDTAFLPCITEEGEYALDDDDKMTEEEGRGNKRDSGNDSTFSTGSSGKMTKEDDSEENLFMTGKMELL